MDDTPLITRETWRKVQDLASEYNTTPQEVVTEALEALAYIQRELKGGAVFDVRHPGWSAQEVQFKKLG